MANRLSKGGKTREERRKAWARVQFALGQGGGRMTPGGLKAPRAEATTELTEQAAWIETLIHLGARVVEAGGKRVRVAGLLFSAMDLLRANAYAFRAREEKRAFLKEIAP